MKFTCEKCGRSYMADEKVRGRAFKMKCRQCGHQIVVKPAALPTPPPGTIPAITPLPFYLDAPLDGDAEDIAVALPLEGDSLSSGPASGERQTATPVALPPPLPRVSPAGGAPAAGPAPQALAAKAPPAPPPVLELEESRRAAEDPFATMAAELSAELANVPEAPPLAPPDPFLSRDGTPIATPLPIPKLSESEEAFADLNRMMDGTSGSRPLLVNAGTVESRKVPKLPRVTPVQESVRKTPPPSPPSRRWAPIVGLGFGLGAVAVVGWLLASSGPVKKLAEPERAGAAAAGPAAQPPRPEPAPAASEPAPAPKAPEPAPAAARSAPAPQVARAPEPEIAVPAPPPVARPPAARPQPPAPKPQPAAAAERRAPRPPRESPPARPAPAPAPPAVALAAPPAQRPVAAAAPAPEPEARPSSPAAVAAAPSSSGGGDRPLDDKDIEATINRHASQFEGCVAQARKAEPQLLAEQRRVTVTMTVNPSGKALYPTLDDQELSATGLGACLKKEASRMAFPAFSGEAVRVRVPLVLR